MPITLTNVFDGPVADLDGAAGGPLSGTLTALCGVATSSIGGGRPIVITANLNVHGPTGSLVTMQIFESVSSTVLAQVQVTLGGNGASDDYRTIVAQASVVTPGLITAANFYGFELEAQVTGGSATVIAGGLSVVSPIGTRSPTHI